MTLERRRVLAWCLFDWANAPYTTLGFFAFSRRLTAFAGPALLGLNTQIFQSQRAGVATILLFFLVGGGLLLGVDEQRGIKRASPAS